MCAGVGTRSANGSSGGVPYCWPCFAKFSDYGLYPERHKALVLDLWGIRHDIRMD